MQLRKFDFREANLRPIKVEPVIMDSGQRDRSTGGESSRNVSGKDGHYRGFNNRFKKNLIGNKLFLQTCATKP